MNKRPKPSEPTQLKPLVVLIRAMLRVRNSPFWRRYDEQH